MLSRKHFIVYGAILIDPLIIQSYNPLVSVFKSAFNVNVELIALSLTFHMLPLAIFSLFSGTLSDLYYRPKILLYGLLISALGSFLAVVSPTIHVFLLSRCIQGVGSALIMPIAYALIGDITAKDAIGKAMGVSGVFMSVVGVTLGPLVSGFLAGIEWRLMPLIISIYTLILGILSKMILKGIVITKKEGSVKQVFKQLTQAARNRNILLLSLIGFISFFTYQGIMPLISDVFSLPPLSLDRGEIGIIFSTIGFVGIFFSFFGGFFVDKMGGKKILIFGFIVMILPIFLLTITNSYWIYLISLSILGGFNKFTNTSRTTLVVEVMPDARGTASSISNFANFLGFATAPVIMTHIYSTLGINSVYFANMFLLIVCTILAVLIRTRTE